MTTTLRQGPPVGQVNFAFDGSIAVAAYDLMYHTGDDVKPAGSQTDETHLLANQIVFANNFAGLAATAKTSSQGADTAFPVIIDAVVDMACSSSAWEVGDLVGIAEASSGTALDPTTVAKVTVKAAAIGHCVERQASAGTTVKCRLTSNLLLNPSRRKAIVDVIAFGDFTDNTNTTGYIDLTPTIPAGSLIYGWEIVTVTGFTGDTTAVAMLGISGDTDAFSEVTTGSVAAAGTIGSNAPATGANAYRAAATTVRVTVTGGADFTSISAGSAVVIVYYDELS